VGWQVVTPQHCRNINAQHVVKASLTCPLWHMPESRSRGHSTQHACFSITRAQTHRQLQSNMYCCWCRQPQPAWG
jgi:hypothetical protein